MTEDIERFIPSYPQVSSKKFVYDIARKKEFYSLQINAAELSSKEKGELLDSQKFMKRFFSPYTTYSKALLAHDPGTGKSCVSSAVIENFKDVLVGGKQRRAALVFVKSDGLAKTYASEIANVCTNDIYIPKLTRRELLKGVKLDKETQKRRINAEIKKTYALVTYETFLSKVKALSDEEQKKKYSNITIVLDEAHSIRIQPTKTEGGDKIVFYNELHRFLHNVENCRILMLTGTPIWDKTSEIASLMNLILDEDEQLPTGSKFMKEYFEENELTEQGREELIRKFRGKVSVLRQMVTTAKREELGVKEPWLSKIIVYPCKMSDFQATYAEKSREEVEKDIMVKGQKKSKKIKGGVVRKLERDAMNMVLPIFDSNGDVSGGEYGPEIFKKYAIETRKNVDQSKNAITRYKISDERLKAELKNNLAEYSAKFACIVDMIKQNPNQVMFIYNEHVSGAGGAIMLALILELHGLKWIKNSSDISTASNQKRFALITSDIQTTSDANQIRDLLQSHNQPDNAHAERLQVIIGSEKLALGYTIKHVRKTFIVMPHWNIPSLDQALARGFRFGSHEHLPENERTIEIYRLVAVNEGNNDKGKGYPRDAGFSADNTTDIEIYKLAETKEYTNAQIRRILKEVAFDCPIMYKRNVLEEDQEGSKVCDYTDCNYVCDSFPYEKIVKDSKIYEYDIPEDEIDYSTYNLFYSDQKVKEYRDNIVGLFKNYFSLRIDMIKQLLDVADEDYFLLLKALDAIIDSRLLIRNRYGFASYLKEEGGIVFLDDNISSSKYIESTYVENPLVTETMTMDSLIDILELENDKSLVKKFCKKPEKSRIEQMSHKSKIVLLEASFIKFQEGSEDPAVKQVMEVLGDNIKEMENGTFIHVMETDEYKGVSYDVAAKEYKVTGLMRYYDTEEQVWKPVSDRLVEEEYVKELKGIVEFADDKVFEDNPYGIIGWISGKDKAFRLKIKKEKGTKGKSRGQRCENFNITELIDIFINKIKYLPEYREEYDDLSKNTLIKRIQGKIGFEKFTHNIEKKSLDDLKSLLTLLTMRREELCTELKKWFEDNNLMFYK